MRASALIYTMIPSEGDPYSTVQFVSTNSEHTEIELKLARDQWLKRSKCDVRVDNPEKFVAEIRGGDVVMLQIDHPNLAIKVTI